MDLQLDRHLAAITRRVLHARPTWAAPDAAEDGPTLAGISLERTYPASIKDLWQSLTEATRIERWFLPVTGDLQVGGRYDLKGNASGTIIACEPLANFSLTWEFGGDVSWVDVEVAKVEDGARLRLAHVSPKSEHWQTYGAGATGVGWEMGLVGLPVHLEDGGAPLHDETAFTGTDAGRAYIRDCSVAWAEAEIAAGEDVDQARQAATRTEGFYTGTPIE